MAALRDDKKIVLFAGAFTRPDVQLFTAAGRSLGRVLWDKGRIMEAGWTSEEQLVAVDDRGQVGEAGRRRCQSVQFSPLCCAAATALPFFGGPQHQLSC